MTLGQTDRTDPLAQLGSVLDDRFRLERLLGSGSVHLVFRAFDLIDERAVCIKLPRTALRSNPGFTMRYRRDVLQVMLHPHEGWLTPLLLGEHDGTPFQVLPILDGQTLPQWYISIGRDSEALLDLLKTALYHLADLHRIWGRIHGAIKPENFLVSDLGEPIFTDLVATGRLEDQFSEKARTGESVYFSPEQLVGERAEPASDMYSVGLVLYRTLAGRHPFSGQADLSPGLGHPERLLTSMLSQLRDRPPDPSAFREDVPRWADRFIARCLQPRPEDRFADPEEAIEWLRHHAWSSPGVSESVERRPLPPVGRDQEMAFMLECLNDILRETPQGTIVRLHGPPGIGKTRCTEWLKEQALSLGVRVVDIYRSPESGLHLQSVANALKGSALAPHPEDPPALARPVVEHLIEAALEAPILLLLDNIARADETLVRLLDELTTVITDLPILLVLSDDGSPFQSPSARNFMEGLDQVMILTPLDRRAIANLIEERAWSAPSLALSQWIHRVSEGNPLAARLLLEFLQNGGHLKDEVELDWASAPTPERPTLSQLVDGKLRRLSPLAQNLLESAAVLGDPFNLSTLAAITYRNSEEVDAAIAEAVKAELLAPEARSGSSSYRWSHSLFRDALRNGLPHRRRLRIHRLAAAFYSRGEPEPAKLAYHFLQSEDTQELFTWGIQAAERARRAGRRGESNYWLNVLLERIEPSRWLGPNLERAFEDIARDQSDVWDLQLWSRWFRALAGRAVGEFEHLDLGDPNYAVQVLLSAPWSLSRWKEQAIALLAEVAERARRSDEGLAPYQHALALLRAEWVTRAGNSEPFSSPY